MAARKKVVAKGRASASGKFDDALRRILKSPPQHKKSSADGASDKLKSGTVKKRPR